MYPPATLRSLVSGFNRILHSNRASFSVLDKGDPRFRDLLKILDTLTSELNRQGIGATKNSAKVIEAEHEDLFWEISLLGYSTPKLLQRTVFLCWPELCTQRSARTARPSSLTICPYTIRYKCV